MIEKEKERQRQRERESKRERERERQGERERESVWVAIKIWEELTQIAREWKCNIFLLHLVIYLVYFYV